MRARLSAGLLSVLIAACSTAPSPTATVPEGDTVPSTPPTSRDDPTSGFVDGLAGVLADTRFADGFDDARAMYVAVGERMCRLLDLGLRIEDLLTISVLAVSRLGEGAGDEDLALGSLVLGAAVAHLCPRHLDLVRAGP